MDFIREWSLCVCTTLIISVIFSILTPKGNMGKIYKMILSMFIFISFLLPFKNGNIDFTLPETDFESVINESQSSEELVKANVNGTLCAGGYDACIINCDSEYINEEIYINSLEIIIPREYDLNEVKEYIYEKSGMVAEVYYLGD